VPSHIPYTVRISAGLNEEECITAWNHPGVDAYRELIAATNDGTLPLEPYQRLSQAVFEAWLKGIADKNPLIDLRFGNKVESVEESAEGVKVFYEEVQTGQRKKIASRYLAACDGASSRIRRSLGIPIDGGPV
jgi:FAD-dependent monooxygenase